jgi:ClpX C4-type zinc finger
LSVFLTFLVQGGTFCFHPVAPPALTAVSEDHKVVCSFCGKSNLQTKLMVAAPADSNSNAVICNECIARCVDIVREQGERKVAEAGREMTVSGKAPRGRKAKKAGHVPGVGVKE